jgi:hypothetical protein
MTNVKDWTDLIHAVAWPIVALIALILFRRSVNDALRRIPFHLATSFKVSGVGEMKIAKSAAKDTVIPTPDPPGRNQTAGG